MPRGPSVSPSVGSRRFGSQIRQGDPIKLHIRLHMCCDRIIFFHIGRRAIIKKHIRLFRQKRNSGAGLLIIQGNQHMGFVTQRQHFSIPDTGPGHTPAETPDLCRVRIKSQNGKTGLGHNLVEQSPCSDSPITGHAAYFNCNIHTCHSRTPSTRRYSPGFPRLRKCFSPLLPL